MNTDIDRRIKDLMGRVAEMAPESPPFPEDAVTVTPLQPRRTVSPALVFAGAALLVLAVALPLLFLGDGAPEPADITAPAPVPTTTVPDTAPTTETPVVETVAVEVYLTQEPENSLRGNPALVPVRGLGSAVDGEPEVLAALRTLVDPELSPPPGLATIIPDGVEVLGFSQEDEFTLVVDMNDRFLQGAGGLLADVTMLNQLIWTATQGNAEAGVRFTVNGAEPGPYGSEGILLDTAFTRDYYLSELNNVLVTTPIGPESTEISGIANVFEANVAYEIRDAAGEAVAGGFTMATCGTGCWGSFTIDVDPDLLEPGGQARLFWNSPEDGEPTNVVVVPIPEDEQGVWDLTTP